MIKKYILIVCIMFNSLVSKAQEVEMATGFRAEGKIYVVVGVVLLILAGLFLYLIALDKRLKKLERE